MNQDVDVLKVLQNWETGVDTEQAQESESESIDEDKILQVACLAGELLLKSGAEIYRTQDTISRILRDCGIQDFHVFVVSSGIFVTINEFSGSSRSVVREMPITGTDLGSIVRVNQISREVCAHKCSVDDALSRLQNFTDHIAERRRFLIAAGGISCAAFGYTFGGSILDCAVAGILGLLLQTFLFMAQARNISKFINDILGSALVTFLANIICFVGVPASLNHVVIGSIMLLVPGVPLTTAIRELFNGDYLSGVTHLLYAIMTAVCIAIGVGGAILLWGALGGGKQ